MLTQCCRELFFEIAMKDPTMLTEAFTVEQFAALQAYGAAHGNVRWPSPGQSFVLHFLDTITHHPQSEAVVFANWMLPLRAITFIKYLARLDSFIVHDVLVCLRSYILLVSEEEAGLLPLLCFTIHLCFESRVASQWSLELGFLEVFDLVLANHSGYNSPLADHILTACALLYSTLQAQISSAGAAGCLSHQFSKWAAHAATLTHLITLQDVLNGMAEHCVNRYVQAQWLTLYYLLAFVSVPSVGGSPMVCNPWTILLTHTVFS